MVQFEEEFFREEVRCGFLVNETMKRVWAAELKVLDDVVSVCEKYGLTYYADYGTLLGAVRHKGYVPWDDDIDIALKRADYQKLLQILPKELPSYYAVNSIYTSEGRNQLISTVCNGTTLPQPKEIVEQFYGCPYIVGLDIYALDYVPREPELEELQNHMYNAVYDLAQRYEQIAAMNELDKYLPQIEEICAVSIDRSRPVRHQLWLLCDRVGSLFGDAESDQLTFFPRRISGNLKFHFPKEWYAGTLDQPFENRTIKIPKHYDEVLTRVYGDYSQYVFGCSGHGYPFFAEQEKFLQSLKK